MRSFSGNRKFIPLFVLTALGLFALLLAPPVRPLVDGFSGQLAAISARLIGLFGGTCTRHAAVLSQPANGFAMEVRDGCNGINVVILLWAAILAYPATTRWKLYGLAAGLAAIQLLNLARLISLFYLGQYSPRIFAFAHLYLWEMLIILDAMLVFVVWIRKAARE